MTLDKLDFRKKYKDLYLPKEKPSIVQVPAMQFIMVPGTGDPNEVDGEYTRAMEILYGLSWTIKMSYKKGIDIEGFTEFVVAPLEGLWWIDGYIFNGKPIANKEDFCWIAMIRQPEFVTNDVFTWAKEELVQKRQGIDLSLTRLEVFEEGLCVQALHKGSYDDEPVTIERLGTFVREQGYTEDISDAHEPFPLARRHHELYLNDPRKTKPENLKTVIRHPIR